MPVMTEDTKIILVWVLFIAFLAISIMIVEILHLRAIKKDRRERAFRILQAKAELRRQKEQEAADDALLDQIQEYRHDFDDDRQAG